MTYNAFLMVQIPPCVQLIIEEFVDEAHARYGHDACYPEYACFIDGKFNVCIDVLGYGTFGMQMSNNSYRFRDLN